MRICTGRDKGLLFLSMLLGAVNAVAMAFVSIALQRIVDVAVRGDIERFERLLIAVIIYMAALCIMGFIEAIAGKLLLRNVTKNLRDRIFRGIMSKAPEDYFKSNSADYLSAIVNDVKLVEENYLIPLLLSAQMVALFLATLGILCYLSPAVMVILAVFLLLMFLIPVFFGKALGKRQEQYSAKLAAFTSKAKDIFSGYEVIRGFSVVSRVRKKFSRENQEAARAKFRADRLIAVNESLAEMMSILSTVVVVFVAAYMVLKGSITAGMLLALIQLSSTFTTPVLVIMQNFPKMAGTKPILEKLGGLCRAETGTEEREEKQAPAHFSKALQLCGAGFCYEPDKPVLKGINLTIEPGKKYALLGDSGCGKTTLVKLITGYSDRYEGSILYDGKEVRNMQSGELSRLISVIHQNVYLFDTDIFQNICLDEEFSREEMENAMEKSGVNRFLSNLENGIHTPVGENGNRLSGGQRQRVALARALIRKTPILVLDEGTSAVDKKTAYEIEKKLLAEREATLVTITHNMQDGLRDQYDRIIQMKQGTVAL